MKNLAASPEVKFLRAFQAEANVYNAIDNDNDRIAFSFDETIIALSVNNFIKTINFSSYSDDELKNIDDFSKDLRDWSIIQTDSYNADWTGPLKRIWSCFVNYYYTGNFESFGYSGLYLQAQLSSALDVEFKGRIQIKPTKPPKSEPAKNNSYAAFKEEPTTPYKPPIKSAAKPAQQSAAPQPQTPIKADCPYTPSPYDSPSSIPIWQQRVLKKQNTTLKPATFGSVSEEILWFLNHPSKIENNYLNSKLNELSEHQNSNELLKTFTNQLGEGDVLSNFWKFECKGAQSDRDNPNAYKRASRLTIILKHLSDKQFTASSGTTRTKNENQSDMALIEIPANQEQKAIPKEVAVEIPANQSFLILFGQDAIAKETVSTLPNKRLQAIISSCNSPQTIRVINKILLWFKRPENKNDVSLKLKSIMAGIDNMERKKVADSIYKLTNFEQERKDFEGVLDDINQNFGLVAGGILFKEPEDPAPSVNKPENPAPSVNNIEVQPNPRGSATPKKNKDLLSFHFSQSIQKFKKELPQAMEEVYKEQEKLRAEAAEKKRLKDEAKASEKK